MNIGGWKRAEDAYVSFRDLVIPNLSNVFPEPVEYIWVEGKGHDQDEDQDDEERALFKYFDTSCGIDGFVRDVPNRKWIKPVSNKVRFGRIFGQGPGWSVPEREFEQYRSSLAHNSLRPVLQVQAWVTNDMTRATLIGVGPIDPIIRAIEADLAIYVKDVEMNFWDVPWRIVPPLYKM